MTTLLTEFELMLFIKPTGQTTRVAKFYRSDEASISALIANLFQTEGWPIQHRTPAHSAIAIQQALVTQNYYAFDTTHFAGTASTRVVALVHLVQYEPSRASFSLDRTLVQPEGRLRRRKYQFNDPLRKRLSAYQESDGRYYLVNAHGLGAGALGPGSGLSTSCGYYQSIDELQARLSAQHDNGGWAQWVIQVARNEWEVMTAAVLELWEAGRHGAAELKADMAIDAAYQAIDELSRVASFVPFHALHRSLHRLIELRFFTENQSLASVASVTLDVRRSIFYAYRDACDGSVSVAVRHMVEQRLQEAKGLAIAAEEAAQRVHQLNHALAGK